MDANDTGFTDTAPRLIVAGMGGGCGKTTVALGMAAAWRRRGLGVVPFKKGPDYIDSAWLERAAGSPCYNLDTFMMPAHAALGSFQRHARRGDVALIEGNRGLYDGMDAAGSHSTAELGKLLAAPIVLVVSCAKVTRTVAAAVLGAREFDPQAPLAGVILNQVSGARQEALIREVVEARTGLPVLGAVRRLDAPALRDRHLGLLPPQEDPDFEAGIAQIADWIEQHVDLDRLLETAKSAPPLKIASSSRETPAPVHTAPQSVFRVAVIRDAAFQFYYPENLEALEEAGGRIVQCSALSDPSLPEADLLYIGGGFPETLAPRLAENESFRRSVRRAAEAGLPIYAECGGLMYLAESLECPEGQFPMAGALPIRVALRSRPQGHGYVHLFVEGPNPFFPVGLEFRGHEFHYSHIVENRIPANLPPVLRMRRGEGVGGGRDGLCYRSTLATYAHVHALGFPRWAPGLAARALKWKAANSPNRAAPPSAEPARESESG